MALVLSGGGVFGAALLGALHSIDTNDFTLYAGTSIGAIIGALLAIGYTPLELLRVITTEPCLVSNVDLSLVDRFGVVSQNTVRELVERLFQKTKARTFQDIYETFGKELIVVGTNLSHQKAVYFQRKDFPDMDVVDALMISSCVPMVFPYIVYENDIYVDGFVTDNFPIRYVTETTKDLKITGINICKKGVPDSIDTMGAYFTTLFNTFVGSKTGYLPSYEIHVSSTSNNQLHADPNTLMSLFDQGFQQMITQKALKEQEEQKVNSKNECSRSTADPQRNRQTPVDQRHVQPERFRSSRRPVS